MSESFYEARPNLPELSVSELSAALKRTVEDRFPFVRVRGEVSGLKFHSSGHVYFDLKDDKAVLNAVIWRMTAQRLRLRPEAGAEVICTGKLTTFPGSSRYQLVVEQVELAGLGALMAILEARKKKLAAEGLFAATQKKALPFLPDVIGVITSPTGAVIRDIMHRLNERFPRRVLLWAVAVQGERAAAEVAAAVAGFNRLGQHGRVPRPDLLIVARGGGSIEDLMPFNDEIVVRAVAASAIPVISAVGHETDTTLIDQVADRRAPTPTAAAEMAVPVRSELLSQTLDFDRRTQRCFSKGLDDRRRHLNQLARVLPKADQLFASPRQRLDIAGERLGHALRHNLQAHRERLLQAGAQLRPGRLIERSVAAGERLAALDRRLSQISTTSLAEARRKLDGLDERLSRGVAADLQKRRAQLLDSGVRLRASRLAEQISVSAERTRRLGDRLRQAQLFRIGSLQGTLDGLDRVLESVSYRSVLERGFALVRGDDGRIRRRGADVKADETLFVTFTDGTRTATVGDGQCRTRETTLQDKAGGQARFTVLNPKCQLCTFHEPNGSRSEA